MSSVPEVLAQVIADRDSGKLAQVCDELDVDLLVLFGSARTRPETAHDIDLAYSFRHGIDGDDLNVVMALIELYGNELIDAMPLDRAGVVAKYAALGGGDVLVELTPQKFARSQIAAFGQFHDTHHFREEQLRSMLR